MNKIQLKNSVITFESIKNIEFFNPNVPSYFSNFIESKLINKKLSLESLNLKVKISLHNYLTQITSSVQIFGRLYDSDYYISKESFLIIDDSIIIYFDGIILSLNLENLKLNWIKEFTDIIDIVLFQNDLFVYDELEILRLDKNGNKKWNFGGMDHFISYQGTDNFIFFDEYIQMVDSNEVIYRISYDGKDLGNINSKYIQ